MAQLYRANGTIEEYPEPANGTDYTLEEMKPPSAAVTSRLSPPMTAESWSSTKRGSSRSSPAIRPLLS